MSSKWILFLLFKMFFNCCLNWTKQNWKKHLFGFLVGFEVTEYSNGFLGIFNTQTQIFSFRQHIFLCEIFSSSLCRCRIHGTRWCAQENVFLLLKNPIGYGVVGVAVSVLLPLLVLLLWILKLLLLLSFGCYSTTSFSSSFCMIWTLIY